jgi:hypothetical protein
VPLILGIYEFFKPKLPPPQLIVYGNPICLSEFVFKSFNQRNSSIQSFSKKILPFTNIFKFPSLLGSQSINGFVSSPHWVMILSQYLNVNEIFVQPVVVNELWVVISFVKPDIPKYLNDIVLSLLNLKPIRKFCFVIYDL